MEVARVRKERDEYLYNIFLNTIRYVFNIPIRYSRIEFVAQLAYLQC